MLIPFIEYYMLPPDPYVNIRYSGTNQMNTEFVSSNIKYFFPDISEKEYKDFVANNQLFNNILKLVQKAFYKWYNFDCKNIFVSNNYKKNFNSYAYIDGINPIFIHVDQLLESIIMSFMLTVFTWAKELDKNNDDDSCFIYLLFIMNELCIFGQLPDENAKNIIMKKVYNDQQLMNLATDCYLAIMVFTIAHEIAHVYQAHLNHYSCCKQKSKELEFNADEIAYDILLKLIMGKQEKNIVMEKYAYLAPMMYMDFFNLYYYTDYILYEIKYNSKTHPTPEERKKALFNIVEREIYQFDTEEGNAVYQWFCMIYDLFIEKLPEYKKSGRLNKVIHNELRKQL